jgi:hypothetical protein
MTRRHFPLDNIGRQVYFFHERNLREAQMKKVYVLIILLVSAASAQEEWGEPELIFRDPTGTGLRLEPCFSNEPDEIIISYPSSYREDFRVMRLDLNLPEFPEPLLPDSLSVEGYNDCSPFLTFDGSGLYFASDRPGGFGGYDIWVTERIDGDWLMPVNLGPAINSEIDEAIPSLTEDNSEMYFLRGAYEQWFGSTAGDLYFSRFADGQWQDVEILPPQVNSGYQESDPSVSADGTKLYFVSYRPNDLQDDVAVWLSHRLDDSWSEPILPTGSVNEYWQECGYWLGHPFSPKIDSSGLSLVYVKLGMFMCFELETRIFTAQLSTGAFEQETTMPNNLSISLYPNPFNSSLSINATDSESAEIEIFDLLGRSVMSFELHDGHNTVTWDGRNRFGNDCPSGIYFIRLSSGGRSVSRSAVLLK